MINIDIVGDLKEELDTILNQDEFELFLINQITAPEDFQEVLVVYPPPKKKLRWKAYTEEEVEILFEYVEQQGGILVLIPPFNSEYFEKTLEIYERFQVSPVLCNENLLLHINPHMINFGKEGKLPIKKYYHFLTPETKSFEVIIEGNWIPIFTFKFIGKGVLILYGLGSTNFWKEDLLAIFKYLQNDYAYFWEKTDLTEKRLEDILKCSRDERHTQIRDAFIRTFSQKKSFKDLLEVRDSTLKEDLLHSIESTIIQDEFKNLSGKFIIKKYRELYRMLYKDYPDLLKRIQQFLYQKIVDKTINEPTFMKLYEEDMLPPQAAYLLVFYLDPKNPENYKKFKENLSKLIEWNKVEHIFEENFLKELAWEHL